MALSVCEVVETWLGNVLSGSAASPKYGKPCHASVTLL